MVSSAPENQGVTKTRSEHHVAGIFRRNGGRVDHGLDHTGSAGAAANAAGTAATATDRDQKGRRYRQRLHFPQWQPRSEERRVGKEWRSRRSTHKETTKL